PRGIPSSGDTSSQLPKPHGSLMAGAELPHAPRRSQPYCHLEKTDDPIETAGGCRVAVDRARHPRHGARSDAGARHARLQLSQLALPHRRLRPAHALEYRPLSADALWRLCRLWCTPRRCCGRRRPRRRDRRTGGTVPLRRLRLRSVLKDSETGDGKAALAAAFLLPQFGQGLGVGFIKLPRRRRIAAKAALQVLSWVVEGA